MIFRIKINITFSPKLVVLFLLIIPRHDPSIQNSKFAIYLEYLKKEGTDEVDFFHADKRQTILQVNAINLCGHGQVDQNCLK